MHVVTLFHCLQVSNVKSSYLVSAEVLSVGDHQLQRALK
jgi:hypothetical protein